MPNWEAIYYDMLYDSDSQSEFIWWPDGVFLFVHVLIGCGFLEVDKMSLFVI